MTEKSNRKSIINTTENKSSEIKIINYVFLVATTIMCCAGSMTIGQALYNDGPIADIVEVQ